MALDAARRLKAARWYASVLFLAPNVTAKWSLDDILNGIIAIDNALDATFQQAVNAGLGAQNIVQGLATQVPAPLNTGSAGEQFLLLVAVSMERGDLIP